MRLSEALLLLLAAQVAAFRNSLFPSRFVPSVASSRTLFAKNILDDIPIEGDLIPLSNNLLIRVKEMTAPTRGGLFIPDNAKERPTEGVVVACGPGRMHPETLHVMDNSAQTGDNVLYGKYDGMELKYNGINHQMIKDDDVLLKFSGGELTLENVVPVKDQVLVRLPEKEERNSAGIIVNTPSSQEKRPTAGVVVKVGPGRQISNGEYSPIQVQPGDGVKFREYGGNQVKIQGKEYMIVHARDIVAKWQP